MCARQHAVAEVACYRLETTLVGCVDSPKALRVGPRSAIESTKDEADESSIMCFVSLVHIPFANPESKLVKVKAVVASHDKVPWQPKPTNDKMQCGGKHVSKPANNQIITHARKKR